MTKRVFWFCLPAAMLFVLLPGAATATTATVLSCGDTITTSVTLTANLNCLAVPGNGLNVGASGIVIRLNGHSIIGQGGASGYSGIYNSGYTNVTVNGHNAATGKDGTIRNFYIAYNSDSAHGEIVTHVHFVLDGTRNYYGLYTSSGTGNTYSYNTVRNGAYGFYAISNAGDKFAHNTLTGNQAAAVEQYAQGSAWTANRFTYSAGSGFEADYGDGTTILNGNTSNHNGGSGFSLNCNGSTVAVVKYNNAFYNGSVGISSNYCYRGGVYSTFTGNKTSHNADAGIYSTYDLNAKFNLNSANANTTYGFYFSYSSGYAVTKNVSNGNGSDGVYFGTGGSYFPSLVSYNSSSTNGGYGFDADALVGGSHDTGTGNTSGLFNNVSG